MPSDPPAMKPPKDYTSTIMRMASNIAAGFVSGLDARKIEVEQGLAIAAMSLAIAQAIVNKAQE